MRRFDRSLRVLFALAVLAVAVSAVAAVPSFWRLESQSDFLPGNVDGVSISSDGVVSLAPSTQVLTEATDPNFWSLALDGNGNVYAGSGNDGKVYKIDATGLSRVIADTNELQVHAVTVDRRGTVYAATSPRGMVYKITSDGSQDVFFDPDDRYIWALALDSHGNLIVATGDQARIYRVSPAGQSEVVFTSEETHIVSLAVDAKDDIYAGTSSDGLVLHIDPRGAASVLFDTPFEEVRSLVLDSRGNVYAGTVNGGSRANQEPSSPSPTSPTTTAAAGPSVATPGGEMLTVTATANVVSAGASTGSAAPSGGAGLAGGLYRIAPDGASDLLWQSRTDIPLAVAIARDDRLMVGTNVNGRVYLVGQDETSALLLSLEADQVTAIRSGSGGETYLATSNPAKIYRLNRGRRTEGTYRSPVMDTKTVSSWGRIQWEARTPSGTTVQLQSRTGNSAEPDNTWSDWSQNYTRADGEQITSPRGRFIQWRSVLNSTGELSPEVLDVTTVYLQQNLPPEVSDIVIHPPGQTFQKPIITTGQLEILGMEVALSDSSPTGVPTSGPGMGPGGMSLTAIARPLYRKGIQTVTWKASDPNDDDLRFDVQYRAEGESLWKVLREGLRSPVVAWDTVAMPDGRYTLRVVANDGASNPADSARTGERISRSFEVDNTPPRVEDLAVQPSANGHQIRFTARDDISPIRSVEYSVNSGAWSMVFPSDGIADSREEAFDFAVPGFKNGVYTLVVKVNDTLGNTVTARAELR
jgi:hypothetical protein